MLSIPKISKNNSLLLLACLFMLFIQASHVHIHNSDHPDSGMASVHVPGSSNHEHSHDQNGEIDLQFESLIGKAPLMPDLLPLILFISIALVLFGFRIKWHEPATSFSKYLVYLLRPPSRASP